MAEKVTPWAQRKAWLVKPEYRISPERAEAVIKGAGTAPMNAFVAALTFAREQGHKKLGPCKYDPDLKRNRSWRLEEGSFGVRSISNGHQIIVEGPPDDSGVVQDWGSLAERKQVEVDGEPGLIELLPEVDNG